MGARGSKANREERIKKVTTMPGKYKLTYFNLRGRGEPIRLAFAVADVPYEDHRIELSDWASLKPKTPMGYLPILTIDGVEICESPVIIGCVGRELGLHGKTNVEAARVDQWLVSMANFQAAMSDAHKVPEDQREASMEKFRKETFPSTFDKLEKLADSSWLVGSSMTVADLMLFDLEDKLGQVQESLGKYEKLAAIVQKVKMNPRVAAWVEKRPQTLY